MTHDTLRGSVPPFYRGFLQETMNKKKSADKILANIRAKREAVERLTKELRESYKASALSEKAIAALQDDIGRLWQSLKEMT